VNGLLIVDKPGGMTSHDVVARVRRITGERSVGHLGTLDPMATGVLPLLLGKWTRLAQFFGKLEKSYTGAIRFGFATTTYDAEGEPVGDVRTPVLELDAVRRAAADFAGTIEQMPPAFSAKKIGGRSAHTLARRGEPVALQAVPVMVHEFVIESLTGETARFRLRISAGGYARSLAHDLGQRLGFGGHLAELRRTAAGPFTLEQAISLEGLQAHAAAGELERQMPHPRLILPEMPCATADEQAAGRLRNGGTANLPEYSGAELVKVFAGRRDLLGIGRRIAGTLFQPMVVLG
jgi:tRNA pseudouridine55 synthase